MSVRKTWKKNAELKIARLSDPQKTSTFFPETVFPGKLREKFSRRKTENQKTEKVCRKPFALIKLSTFCEPNAKEAQLSQPENAI